jgi:hypothetical protein
MDKLFKLMEKKGKKISPIEQKAKSDVLSKLQGEASDSMGEKLSGLQKVSVAAPDKDGLKAGLEKAEDLLEGAEGSEIMEDSAEPDEMEQYKDCSPDELQEKIDALMKLKEEKLSEGQE